MNIKKLALYGALLMPVYSWANCTGINRADMSVEYGATEDGFSYVAVHPALTEQTLTASGTKSAAMLEYNGQCEVFDLSNYNGLAVYLPEAGGTFDGSGLDAHQRVTGSDNDDNIQTGSEYDFVFSHGGNDTIFTHDGYEYVDGGAGTDCLVEGQEGPADSHIKNIESSSCATFLAPSEAFTQAYERCDSQLNEFSTYSYNGLWGIQAIESGIELYIEQYDDYVLAYTKDYQHCAYTSGIHSISVSLSDGNDVLNASGSNLNFTVYGRDGKDSITTGSGHDLLVGGADKDTIKGGAGNDWIIGDSLLETDHDGIQMYLGGTESGGNDDKLYGEAGDDVLFGNKGSDKLHGGDGDDLLFGNDGSEDRLYGNSGADLLVDSGGSRWNRRAKFWGGSGQDIIVCEGGHCELSGGGSKDFLAAISTYSDIGLYGGDGGDILFVRGDEIPKGKGGSGKDYCYNEWGDRDICDYLSSVNSKSGYFDDAVRRAARGMSSRHEESLNLIRFNERTGYRSFKQKIANLVSEAKFEKWLENRSTSVFDL
ncbi:calcium-binding protein [Pseudoalteromonas rubra]|uniref:calcium-binding protein n=1 Tax=Pseudoalteromonas rubra TaxID=43658 RepID=UPI000F7A74EF|nr:calcium-binding protein [Pseudoalteromonas rubra]